MFFIFMKNLYVNFVTINGSFFLLLFCVSENRPPQDSLAGWLLLCGAWCLFPSFVSSQTLANRWDQIYFVNLKGVQIKDTHLADCASDITRERGCDGWMGFGLLVELLVRSASQRRVPKHPGQPCVKRVYSRASSVCPAQTSKSSHVR